jgi:glycosyltransferase involved in cell wall biosynthesis
MLCTRPIRLGLICDYPEEGWTSMDVVAEMVLGHLASRHAQAVAATRICPPFRRRFGRGLWRRSGAAFNVDRLLNRFGDYPRALRRIVQRDEFDIYHLVDHSYAQLVSVLPAARTVVTCHDLDTFRCLLEPQKERRPAWFQAMTRRVLEGFQQAAAVVCDSAATAEAVRAHDLVPEARLHVVHLGVAETFCEVPDPTAEAEAARLLGGPARPDAPELLHVGTTIPRKRIDVLLRICADVQQLVPEARLVRVGPPLTADQEAILRAGPGTEQVVALGLVSRPVLAALYRRAAVVLLPSEAEGFGLPVAEALACGAVVLASDIPVLREVGGGVVSYAPVGDVPCWVETLAGLLAERSERTDAWQVRRAAGIVQARRYRWSTHVDRLLGVYRGVWNPECSMQNAARETRKPAPDTGSQAR